MPRPETCLLLIDDEKNFRRVTGLALREEGFDVAEAGDGQEGLQRLQDGDIDVVLCDLNMPVMDGMEFLEAKARNCLLYTSPSPRDLGSNLV